MSNYYCSEHTDNADSQCITCEAAREWIEKDNTIATQQAHIEALEKENSMLVDKPANAVIAELKARIAALKRALDEAMGWNWLDDDMNNEVAERLAALLGVGNE